MATEQAKSKTAGTAASSAAAAVGPTASAVEHSNRPGDWTIVQKNGDSIASSDHACSQTNSEDEEAKNEKPMSQAAEVKANGRQQEEAQEAAASEQVPAAAAAATECRSGSSERMRPAETEADEDVVENKQQPLPGVAMEAPLEGADSSADSPTSLHDFSDDSELVASLQKQVEEQVNLRRESEAQAKELQKKLQEQVDEADICDRLLKDAEKELGIWKNKAKRQAGLRMAAQRAAAYAEQKFEQQERVGKVWQEKAEVKTDLRKQYQQRVAEAESSQEHWHGKAEEGALQLQEEKQLRQQAEELVLEWKKHAEREESGRKKAEQETQQLKKRLLEEERLRKSLEKRAAAEGRLQEQLTKEQPCEKGKADVEEEKAVAGQLAWAKKLQDVLKLVDARLTEEVRHNIDTSLKAGILHDVLMRKMEAARQKHEDPNSACISIGLLLDAMSPIAAALEICPSEHMTNGVPRMMHECVSQSKELANTPGMSREDDINTEAVSGRWSSSCSRWYVCQYGSPATGKAVSQSGCAVSLYVDLSGIVCGSGASSALAPVEAGASDDEEKKPLHDFVWVMCDIPDDDPRQQGMKSFGEQVLSSESIDNATKKLSHISALESNPENAIAWLRLGKSAGNGGRVGNISYDKKACFRKAVERDPQSSDAWTALGESCKHNDEVSIGWSSFGRQACMIVALELNNQNGHAWHILGMSLPYEGAATVNGRSYSNKDCMIRALEEGPENPDSWCELGLRHNGAVVNGITYTETECYVRGLEINPDHEDTWRYLGLWGGGGTVNGVRYDKKDCFIQALRLNPKCAPLWTYLGEYGGGTVNGISYDANQCFLRAFELNPDFPTIEEGQ